MPNKKTEALERLGQLEKPFSFKRLLSSTEVAFILGVSERFVRRLHYEMGHLKAVRIQKSGQGEILRFRPEDVRKFIEERLRV